MQTENVLSMTKPLVIGIRGGKLIWETAQKHVGIDRIILNLLDKLRKNKNNQLVSVNLISSAHKPLPLTCRTSVTFPPSTFSPVSEAQDCVSSQFFSMHMAMHFHPWLDGLQMSQGLCETSSPPFRPHASSTSPLSTELFFLHLSLISQLVVAAAWQYPLVFLWCDAAFSFSGQLSAMHVPIIHVISTMESTSGVAVSQICC